MAHYALIDENNKVVNVIVGIDEAELIEGKSPEEWYGEFHQMRCLRTSYNTVNGKHYSHETGKWSKSRQFRGNFAGVGFTYNEQLDAFLPPKTFESWVLNEEEYMWEAPIPRPDDGNDYLWDEENIQWVLLESTDV